MDVEVLLFMVVVVVVVVVVGYAWKVNESIGLMHNQLRLYGIGGKKKRRGFSEQRRNQHCFGNGAGKDMVFGILPNGNSADNNIIFGTMPKTI